MSLEKTQHGTFYITDVTATKAPTAGGIDGFPKWTRAAWLKRLREKSNKEKSEKKN